MKYGYESSDAFTNAFKNFHDGTPTEVRNGKPYRLISPIHLAITVRGGKQMDVKIQRKEDIHLVGVKLENIDSIMCTAAWDKLYSKYDHNKLVSLGNGQSYGVCFAMENSNKINYMAAYDAVDFDITERLGLDTLKVEAAEYAIFQLKGRIPESIQEGWKYAVEVFFPEEGYKHSGKPDFEVYSEGDVNSDAYEMELWIPIEKLNK